MNADALRVRVVPLAAALVVLALLMAPLGARYLTVLCAVVSGVLSVFGSTLEVGALRTVVPWDLAVFVALWWASARPRDGRWWSAFGLGLAALMVLEIAVMTFAVAAAVEPPFERFRALGGTAWLDSFMDSYPWLAGIVAWVTCALATPVAAAPPRGPARRP